VFLLGQRPKKFNKFKSNKKRIFLKQLNIYVANLLLIREIRSIVKLIHRVKAHTNN